MSKQDDFLRKLIFAAGVGITGYFGLSWVGRKTIKTATNSFIHRLMVDKYHENLWEFVSATRKVGLQNIIETNLRSQEGKLIKRPLGSPRSFPGFDSILFNFAQLHRLPTDEGKNIDTSVIIGPQAKKPLKIEMPIMISGMAYGLALSKKAKIALARGTALAGTATNTGEGAFLPAERKAAEKLIIQYNRGNWTKSEKILKQADAIEIHIGQGAGGGTGHAIPKKQITWKVRRALGLKIGERAIIHATFPGMKDQDDFSHLVVYLKEITEGVPVGVKVAGSKYIEKDLEIALDAGVDFIAIDGSQAGSKGTAPILQDDFGLPTLFALIRASEYLKERNLQDKVSLIMSGGFYNPGQMLKALALGADAIYIGAIALFAMAHTEVLKALPWEPPPSVVFYDGHFKNKLIVKKGTQNMAKFLNACDEEIKEGIRALGKNSLKEVNKEDLFALDEYASEIVGIPLGYKKIPFDSEK
ncbi:MAG: glutamate synthase [Peptococcaceae bacterium BICA1-8]|nr:MAG: glutamate synthase [Peptococcaceae bacterium BICA1-8]